MIQLLDYNSDWIIMAELNIVAVSTKYRAPPAINSVELEKLVCSEIECLIKIQPFMSELE